MTHHEWLPRTVTKLLTNPIYTGIRVHPDLTMPRSICRDKYIAMAKQTIEDFGAEDWLRDFLLSLRQPDTWALLGVHADKTFIDERPVIISEDQFVKAGVRLIDEHARRGAHGSLIAFLHPKATAGVLIELCQPHPLK